MSSVAENIKAIRAEIPETVKLIAVSKTKPAEAIVEAYQCGQKQFAENKVQELVAKYEKLPKDIEWHFIGHLQTNKVKYIAPFVHTIHSVESQKLLSVIDKEARKQNRSIHCLLQFYIAKEETKFGFSFDEAVEMLKSQEFTQFQNIIIAGVMGMATYTDDTDVILNEFKTLAGYFHELKNTFFLYSADFKELSMGMSGDYQIAIEAGSTMIRVGSSIFGERVYL